MTIARIKDFVSSKPTHNYHRSLMAVQQNGHEIRDIFDAHRTPELCIEAVKQNGHAIRHLNTAQRTLAVCLEAVKENGHAIQYIPARQRTPEVCAAAVRKDLRAIQYLTGVDLGQPNSGDLLGFLDDHWDTIIVLFGEVKAAELGELIVASHDQFARSGPRSS